MPSSPADASTDRVLVDLFMRGMEEMYDAEYRVSKVLAKSAIASTCPKLLTILVAHQLETESHVIKLEKVFAEFDEPVRGRTSRTILGLVDECDSVMLEFTGSPAGNAALIFILRKIEHYEMATYACLRDWAVLLGSTAAAELLEEIFLEEKSAEEALISLAAAVSNSEALGSKPRQPYRENSVARYLFS